MKSGLIDKIVAQDIFGRPIHVNYKGSDSYQTRIGALCTVLTYTIMIFNLITTSQAFLSHANQEEKSRTTTVDSFDTPAFYLEEHMFELSVLTNMPLDPRIAVVFMERVNDGKGTLIKEKECSEEKK